MFKTTQVNYREIEKNAHSYWFFMNVTGIKLHIIQYHTFEFYTVSANFTVFGFFHWGTYLAHSATVMKLGVDVDRGEYSSQSGENSRGIVRATGKN